MCTDKLASCREGFALFLRNCAFSFDLSRPSQNVRDYKRSTKLVPVRSHPHTLIGLISPHVWLYFNISLRVRYDLRYFTRWFFDIPWHSWFVLCLGFTVFSLQLNVGSKISQRLKYSRFSTSGCKDIGIRRFMFKLKQVSIVFFCWILYI